MLPKGNKKLNYRKKIARQLRTQYVESIYDNSVTLKSGLEVTQTNWNWYHSKAWFLFAFYSNYGVILYRLRDIAICWSKIAKFFIPHL